LFLLERERLKQTLRLVLGDAFEVDDFESHEAMRRAQQVCPTLFEQLIPQSDLTLGGFEDEDMDVDADHDVIQAGEGQSAVKAIGRITNEHVTSVWNLPTRAATMHDDFPEFRAAMRKAYRQDLGQNVTHFRGYLQYFNKFAYTNNETGQRFVYKVNDFVRARSSICRIDQIFVHRDGNMRVLLLKVTPAMHDQNKPPMDPILNQPRLYLDRSAEDKIITVSSILPEKVWLVPVKEDPEEAGLLQYDRDINSAEGGLIHVQWTIHYL